MSGPDAWLGIVVLLAFGLYLLGGLHALRRRVEEQDDLVRHAAMSEGWRPNGALGPRTFLKRVYAARSAKETSESLPYLFDNGVQERDPELFYQTVRGQAVAREAWKTAPDRPGRQEVSDSA